MDTQNIPKTPSEEVLGCLGLFNCDRIVVNPTFITTVVSGSVTRDWNPFARGFSRAHYCVAGVVNFWLGVVLRNRVFTKSRGYQAILDHELKVMFFFLWFLLTIKNTLVFPLTFGRTGRHSVLGRRIVAPHGK